MDELDRRLIVELQNNPRQSNKHLSVTLAVDKATVSRRIENLISSSTIILTALPNLKILGYPTRVLALLHVEHSRVDKIGEQLCQIPYIRFVGYCKGFAEFLIAGDLTSLDALEDFIVDDMGNLQGISRIETFIAYKELKHIAYQEQKRTNGRIGIPQLDKTTESQTKIITISKADRSLIMQLQKDARAPLKELAQTIGVSEVTIHRRIKELISSGVIELTTIPDEAKIGYPARCYVRIQTELTKMRDVAKSITQYPQVIYVALVSGPAQILVGIHGLSDEYLSEFVARELGRIEGIINIESLTFTKVLKQAYTWLNE